MKKHKYYRSIGLVLIAGGVLAGCQINDEVASPPLINGTWQSSDNVYSAKFDNGRFVATANDTGGVISEGNYILQDDTKVKIEWVGRVSGKSNLADCTKTTDTRLDCVDKNGSRFSLVRTLPS